MLPQKARCNNLSVSFEVLTMKKIISLIILLFIGFAAKASHISGGEIYYTYLGKSANDPNKLSYKITLLLYKDTTVIGANVANLNGSYNISIYKGSDNSLLLNTAVTRVSYDYLKLTTYNPCLSNRPRVEFSVAAYETTVDLDPLADGYYVSHSQCCRVAGVVNMTSQNIGITYWVKIPGSKDNPFAPDNSSAFFNKKDTILVCKSTPLNLDFSATDIDKDSLVYSFAPGYYGADVPPNQLPVQSDVPPYGTVSYTSGYTFNNPLGTNATINSQTGMVTGVAPATTGIYLIVVIVAEYRNGQKIGEHRKEFQIKVEDCSISGAQLQPSYLNCNDLTFTFTNLSSASNIISYLWTFGEPTRGSLDSSTSPIATHTYKDTGVFVAKLKVTASGGCVDSTTTTVSAFPGFVANFKVDGSCLINPYQFTDLTVSKYGLVNSWTWDFGETTVTTDTSTLRNPTYKYPALGSKTATLIAKDSKGCTSTFTQTITVPDKPSISLPFKDTLICSIDTLQLFASSSGSTYSWTPVATIRNPNTANPFVAPKDTTVYYVSVNNNGCVNTDSITVNVLDFITVNAGPDTAICQTDIIQLHPISDALSYSWSSSTGVAVPAVKNPSIQPLMNTTYYVTANLGKCQDKDTVSVVVNPYPLVTASTDASICFGNRVQLSATIVGDSFTWSPTSSMINSNTLTPTAGPIRTTDYIISVTNTTGCLKTVRDTVKVTVIPPVAVFAGNDTSVVINQPLQLTTTTNTDTLTTRYLWTPSTWLNNSNIYNPIATITSPIDSIRYKVRATTAEGCFGEDEIFVRVYRNAPDILVPSGFTPNGDGRNDIIKAIPIGIKTFQYFNVYNRFGQLMYSSPEIGKGWDGIFAGTAQPSGTYVYSTQGVDYLGNIIFRKGTVVLIR